MTSDGAAWRPASVRSARRAAHAGRILELDVESWSGSLPGQHIDIRLTAEDGYQAVRAYSLASYGDRGVEIAVVALPDGEVSPFLVETIESGDDLEVRGPIGGYFVWRADDAQPVQLIGGGSGIVPLVSIARAHAESASTAPMRLLYSVRTRDDALYLDELEMLRSEHFELDVAYTRRAPVGVDRQPRRLDTEDLAAHVLPAALDPTVFVCGPTPFVEAVADGLVAAGHASERIRTERFGGATSGTDADRR